MEFLSTWISTFTSCTTIFSSGSFLQSEPERALVNSEGPWDLLNSTDVLDCATLLIFSVEDLTNATEFVLRTKKDIIVVLLLPNVSSDYLDKDWNSYQTHFDIHILAKKDNDKGVEGNKGCNKELSMF